MKITLMHPPLDDPTLPYHSTAYLMGHLIHNGFTQVFTRDLNIEFVNYCLQEKVVNRLRQVTSSIKQEGANQVSIITSTAERQAAVEFAKAAAMRPRIVGEALNKVAADPEVEAAMRRSVAGSHSLITILILVM